MDKEFDYLAEKQNKGPLNQQMVINYTYNHRNANQYVTYPRSEKKLWTVLSVGQDIGMWWLYLFAPWF